MTVDAQALFDEKDYTGTYPYVADGVIGPYTPANRDHPAYSAPAPGVRYRPRHYAARNLRPYLGYYYACQNYMILASEPAVLRMDNISEEMFFPTIQDLYEEGKGWVITPNPPDSDHEPAGRAAAPHRRDAKNCGMERAVRYSSRSSGVPQRHKPGVPHHRF